MIRKKEERLLGMVKLPVGSPTRTRGSTMVGVVRGVMRRRVADFHDDSTLFRGAGCNGGGVLGCMSCAKLDPRRRGHYCQACLMEAPAP